jgi:hypothetical protein
MATVEPHATALPLSAPQTNALQANVPPANVPAQPIPTAIVEPLAARPVDPIDEAPAAVWYVRPSGGGQYGPAPGTIMRQWIAEGRIGAESLVWREDWPEWKPACDVFPPPDAPRTVQIEPASAAIATAAPAISSHSDAAPTPAATPNPISRRSRSNSAALFWTVGLSIMVLVLLVVLVVVLSTQT